MDRQTVRPRPDGALRMSADRLGGPVFAILVALSAFFVLVIMIVHAERLFSLPASLAEASKEDLPAFWIAGRMALEGAAAKAYDPAIFQAALPPPNDTLLWLNPPHFLLLAAPLGLLSYGGAKALMLVLTFGALAGVARLAARGPLAYIAIALSPAMYASILVLQLAPFIVLGLIFSLTQAKTRPLLAGFVLALLTVKPQYGLLVPVFLAAAGCWRAIGAAAFFTLLLMALSALIFGVETWTSYFSAIAGGLYQSHASSVYQAMISLSQSAGKLGAELDARALIQFLGLAAAAVAVWRTARTWPPDASVGFTLLAAAFAAPSVWLYDWPLIAGGLFMLARASAPWPLSLQLAAGALWMSALIPLGVSTMTASLAPPAMLTLCIVMFWLWRGKADAIPETAPRQTPDTPSPAPFQR